jgi:adenylate cyclase
MLTPLSPVNPTLVNGVPISETCALRTGDHIEIAEGIALRLDLFGRGDSAATLPRGRDTRRMFAILSADVVAYSRLVENDDMGTARQLETRLAIIRRETENADGRIVNITGDAVLSVFNSVISAVNCAISSQRNITSINETVPPTSRVEFRVGINSGEVLITPINSLHGDAINIAVRVQSLSPPGGVLVTGVVYDELNGRNDVGFEYLGIHQLKNLSREVRVYRVVF